MIKEIENMYSNVIDWKKYMNCYMLVTISFIIIMYILITLLKIPFYFIFLSYIIAYIMIYIFIFILIELDIDFISWDAFKIKQNFKRFNNYKYEKRKNVVKNILIAYNCFSKEEILFLISIYKNKKKKEIYRDWITILISLIIGLVPIFTSYFFLKIATKIVAYIISIVFFTIILYFFHKVIIKGFSNNNLKYGMYEELELILNELYFDINKEKKFSFLAKFKKFIGIN